jgi:hypothetical protein
MSEKTQAEIDAEIKALKACKSYIPHQTAFGDDNWKKVDFQIEYLKGDIDTTTDEFLQDYDDGEQSSIIEAQDWKNGDIEESPSSGWDNFKPKAKGKK